MGETDPRVADSDGDGLADGEEDANSNGQVDPGESDPRTPDSDGDGLDDGIEIEGDTLADARDTDGDGLTDGEEDANGNGRQDGDETDPRRFDTDGDGIGDADDDAPLEPFSDRIGISGSSIAECRTTPGRAPPPLLLGLLLGALAWRRARR
jgi:MYXO-CTERM domain-containing protein